jgi:hypothetical protein
MDDAQTKLGARPEEGWWQLDGVVAMAERGHLKVQSCALLAKEMQEQPLWCECLDDTRKYVFCQIIGRCVLASFPRIGVPVALRVNSGELSAPWRCTFCSGCCGVLGLQPQSTRNDLGVDAGVPDSQRDGEGIVLHTISPRNALLTGTHACQCQTSS